MSVLLKTIPYQLKDPSLLDNKCFIGSKWVESSTGKSFAVLDPEDDQTICHVPDLSRREIQEAIGVAHESFLEYRRKPARERRALLRKWADLIKANKEDLAAICTLELGKPFTESLGTVKYGTDYLDWFDGLIEQVGGETIPAARPDNRIITIRQPQGVVAAITPWNSPIAMIARKAGAAIAVGNTVVCKPAPETPLCAIALAKLAERAGYPPGVFNVVTVSPERTPEIGAELCENPKVRHLSFTGSTAVGRFLNGECAKRMKRTSMELGGNAPFIVFEDAKLGQAVDGLIASKFRSSGQTCVCANRILVHETIFQEFAERLAKRVPEALTSGSVWDPKTNYGPLYSGKGLAKVQQHWDDAVKHGAKVLLSDESPRGPNFVSPTILSLPSGMDNLASLAFSNEETFGPLAILVPFAKEEEAVRYANSTSTGLASYFYTSDFSRIWRVAEALETGMVGVSVGLVSAVEMPFGGIKQSGVGREGGAHCLEEYTELKAITIGI
ncbi:aldehyde dehydrogenase [Eremomyces bilateralis CBS 781.70]|uniref:Succinate-semialdehyde dehydrogenase, mitochondrial n=1 Tax=Eremomyces bilateralis CBS 781.70 TaxID=1392243 RepID=A0A6G1FS50_9PEZI|nr:aldehyde dehydrogenase [Eremomyces bilateralis CBS 781.70]KAF1808603.1 aldehyde dehydrogenase [Eremomyces bilateralis CBS 781.70]